MREVTGLELHQLWEQAKRNELPQRRRIYLPSGKVADEWNVAVRGAANLCGWAVVDGPTPRDTRIAIARREKTDMEHLWRLLRGDGVELGRPHPEVPQFAPQLTGDASGAVLSIDQSPSEIDATASRERQARIARDFG